MIGWDDIYKVVSAMVPLYIALTLGYGSVKWWRLFNADHCDVVNRLFCFIVLPFFTFEFTAHTNPFKWNFRFIAADFISKVIIVGVIGLWAKYSSKGNYCWSITSYSLTLSNTLVMGVPILKAMYGTIGVEIAVLSTILQCIFWFIILMFVLECHRSWESSSARVDIELQDSGVQAVEEGKNSEEVVQTPTRPSFWALMKVVWIRLAVNPNSYACIIGIIWALIASRWNIELPAIVDKSVQIMSNAGSGMAMFSTGMFMAMQQKIIACGTKLTIFGMTLKFVVGPIAMAIGALIMGLRGNLLRVVIAALPQAITCFVYAKEYGLHADILSTAVIFGTVVSLPIMIGYYIVLDSIH
ncbi:hypothetical protein V2J09_023642 [Rumex salicifolius]